MTIFGFLNKKNCFPGIFILVLLSALPLSAQKVKIVKIIDTNLFELKDGRVITLADVSAPSVSEKDSALRFIAQRILDYAQKNLLNQTLRIEPSPASENDSIPIAVHLFLEFPLQKININEYYLREGFGKYAPVDSVYKSRYLKAAREAQSEGKGVYNPGKEKFERSFAKIVSISGGFGIFPESENELEISNSYREFVADVRFTTPKLSGILIKAGILTTTEKHVHYWGDGSVHTYKSTQRLQYFVIHGELSGRYFGMGFGFSVLAIEGGHDPEGPDQFAVPNVSLKAGYLGKLYFSGELLTDILFAPYSFGVNYSFQKPFSGLWIGASGISKNWSLGLKLNYRFREHLMLNIQAFHKPFTKIKGFRLGAGYVF
ncbi:MAG: hypothetical protein GXO77_13035 [Calditrichaeota bacterium]|nr:hypothetical protein [Calditrichota bacterium]